MRSSAALAEARNRLLGCGTLHTLKSSNDPDDNRPRSIQQGNRQYPDDASKDEILADALALQCLSMLDISFLGVPRIFIDRAIQIQVEAGAIQVRRRIEF